jgi:hypothetical protein
LGNPAPNGEGGGLDGHAPKTFDGDRSKTLQFIQEFELFRMINISHRKMRVAATRVGIALSYIKGENVNDWVFKQITQLSIRVNGDDYNGPTHAPGDEALWRDFVADFKSAFVHTASREEAYARLQQLVMKDLDVDAYTARFEALLAQAEWERRSQGSIELFKDGLPAWLTRRIIFRDHRPMGMNGWQTAAREEVERELEVRATLGNRKSGTGGVSTRTNKYAAFMNTPKEKDRCRDPNAMDVDVNIIKTRLSKEERDKLAKEGSVMNRHDLQKK